MEDTSPSLEMETPAELVWLDRTADILDNKFRLPGTDFRFGVDAVMGLIPYVGDIMTVVIGGGMIITMYRKGASGKLVMKMLSNVALDAMVGTIPLLGDIFDFRYRSHRRNVNLMKEHYEEGKHRGSAWGVILLILALIILMFVLIFYGVGALIHWVVS